MPQSAASNRVYVEQIPVKLTSEELIMKGRELARLGIQIASKEAEKKSVTATIKAEIDRLEEDQQDLIHQINTGEESRPIECYERPRYQDLIVDIVRADLGTVWSQRPMHPDERQLAINTGDVELTSARTAAQKSGKKKKPDPHEETSESAH